MPDVRLPDGTVIKNVPEGVTKSDLRRRLGQINQPQSQPRSQAGANPQSVGELMRQPTFLEAAGRSAASQFLDNILGVPDLLLTAGGRMATGQPLVDRRVEVEGVTPQEQERLNMRSPLPNVGDRVLPLPTGEQVVAGAETAAEVPGALLRGDDLNLQQRFEAQQREAQQTAQQRPGATTVGDVAGDVGTLLTGRLPVRGMVNRGTRSVTPQQPGRMAPGLKRQLDDITTRIFGTKKQKAELKSQIDKLKESGRAPFLQGLGKAGEAGFEGAVLAVLDEGDPVQTAAFSAGSQAGGSIFLSMSKPLLTSAPGLLSTVAIGTVGLQLFKEAVPGGQDRILESVETSIFKVLPTVALGALAAGAGFGRAGPRFRENMPKVADAITAIPRGSLVSLMKDLAKDEEDGVNTTATVLEQFNTDPEFFGTTARRRLQRAIKNGKLRNEISKLMENRAFRSRLEEIE